MKLVLKVMVAAIILIVAIPVYFVFTADSTIRSAVEEFGPDVLGVPVKLESATLSIKDAGLMLDGLVISNPDGYSSPHSVSVGKIDVALDPMSLMSDTVQINRILIDQPDLIWEVAKGGSNFQAIQDHLEAKFPTSGDEQESEGPKAIIDEFVLSGANVSVVGLPLQKDVSVSLGEIRLTNIGAEENGATYADIAKEVTGALMPAITSALAQTGIGGMAADLIGTEDISKDALKDKAEDTLKKGLGKLLGGKDKDKDGN